MKPPVSRNPAVVAARILDAAEAEFIRSGYAAANTNAITEAFEGSKATLFKYYPTKALLLEAVVKRISQDWRAAVAWRNIADPTPQAWLEAFAIQVLGWILSERVLFVGRLGVAEGRNLPELQPVFKDLAVQPLNAVLAQKFESWKAQGRVQCDDPDRLASHFMDLVVSGPVSRALYGMPRLHGADLHEHVEAAVRLFLTGVLPRR